MKLSARNQFRGKVKNIEEGSVNGMVTIDAGAADITAMISLEAIKDLGLEEGKEAVAVIKATDVMVGLGRFALSARNQFPGVIESVDVGAVNDIVRVKTDIGMVTSTISKAAVNELLLQVGQQATAVIKASAVLVGVDD